MQPNEPRHCFNFPDALSSCDNRRLRASVDPPFRSSTWTEQLGCSLPPISNGAQLGVTLGCYPARIAQDVAKSEMSRATSP